MGSYRVIGVVVAAYAEGLIQDTYLVYHFSFNQHAEALTLVHLHILALITLERPGITVTGSVIMTAALGIYETNVWMVTYRAAGANYSISAILGQSGRIMQTYRSSG